MNKNKYFAIPIWEIINIICLLLYIYNIFYVGEVVLCDSNECINDFVAGTTQDDDLDSIHPPTGLFFKFKRKLSWYINGKKSGQFSSYNEYKDSWTNNSIWKILKDDFRKTRANVDKDLILSSRQNEKLMTDIYNQRITKDIMNQERRNTYNTK